MPTCTNHPVSIRRGVPRWPLIFTILGLVVAQSSAAQSTAWSDIDHYRVELAAVSDTIQLKRAEKGLGGRAASSDTEARRLLRRGLVRLRLGEMGDGWSFGRAAGDFSDATTPESELSAYAWYARGMALRAQYEWHAANKFNIGKRVGFGSLESSVEAFAHALEHDPTFVPAIAAMFDAATTLRDTVRISEIVLPALRAAASAGVTDPSAFLALNRAERVMGDPGHAVDAARGFLAHGGDPGLGLRELAASGFVLDDSVADSAYFAGAAYDDSVSVAAYREDLALISDDSVMARFDASSGTTRVEFLRDFWSDKARSALRDTHERLKEHFRRINHAERYFKLEVNRRYYSTLQNDHDQPDLYRSGSMRFDDRGVVYVRYGEPQTVVKTVTMWIYPNETWVYKRADGDLLLHFAANWGGDIHDMRLIPSVTAIDGVDARNADNPATLFAFIDRCKIYEPYCKYLNWGNFGRQRIIREERAIVIASTNLAVSTDGQELIFSRPLGAAAKAFAVGQAADRQLIHVAYQVALEPPDSLPEGAAFKVPLRIRVNLRDSLGRSRGWVDTTTTILMPGGGMTAKQVDAVGRVTLTAPVGRWRYQIALSYDDSTGQVMPSDTVNVRDFSGARLALSDLVLSKDGKGAPWAAAPGDTAWFNPRTTWNHTDVLAVYHEVYGLTPGSPYREELILRKGKKAALTLGWSGTAPDSTLRVARMLSLEKVKPGDYVMEFAVQLPDGQRTVTRQALRVE